jgi:hypothetical protein
MPVRRLLAACPPGTDKVLRRVAVAGAAVDTEEFVALSGTDEETAFAVLDAALAAGLLEPAEVGYFFHTGRIRERLPADLPPRRLQWLHRGPRPPSGPWEPRRPASAPTHLLQAGNQAAAVPYLLTAAESSAALGAYRDALDLVERVRDVATGAHRARMLSLRADLLLAVGNVGAVAA